MSNQAGNSADGENQMNLSRADENYAYFSQSASEIARRACYAGIAFIWLLALGGRPPSNHIHVESDLIWVGLVLLVVLGIDFLHYVVSAACWGGFRRMKERQIVNADRKQPH